tara:strand:+ start:100 stop:300 length:201 start_codon:yes stop_codon:yes gene_type:complete
MKAYNREKASLKECYDNLIFLKDMRNEIPHDFKMSSNLKKADKLLVEEIKYWENAISSRDRSKKTS